MSLRLLLLGSLSLFLLYGFGKPEVESVRVLKWKGGATAAYTIIHDDLCNRASSGIHRYADTIAYNRGISFGAGAIVGSCVEKGDYMWNIMERMVNHGHEILSHSWSHGAAVDRGSVPADWLVERDVVMTKNVIEENVPGAEVLYMIFPYDAYDDARLNELAENGYLGSRSGKQQYLDRGVVTDFNDYDPFRSNYFDAFVSREDQARMRQRSNEPRVSVYSDEDDDIELQHVLAAISTGGWSVQELHSVDDEQPWGWGRMGVERYRALMDFVKNKADKGLLWVGTPTEVLRYIMTREHLPAPQVDKGNVIKFSVPEDFDLRYATELTIEFQVSGEVNSVEGKQGLRSVAVRKSGENRFVTNINPVQGDVRLVFNKEP